MHTFLIFLSVVLTLGAIIPYMRDIRQGDSKPNIVSWITWTLLTGIATIAELVAHSNVAAILTGAAMLETLSIVLLGLKYGYVKYTKFDVVCQVGALFGFVLWWLFNSPAVAVIAAVTIDLIGELPTIKHAWMKSGEETWLTYGMSGLGAICTIFALTEYNWTSLTYAVYIVGINFLLAGIILGRSRLVTP